MSDLPARVRIHEEGPREGFQMESADIPTHEKVRLIEALAESGLHRIACASFVDPRRVPSMADADTIARTIRRRPGVSYSGMWLNERGFERALESTLDVFPGVAASASAAFLLRNNNCSPEEQTVRQTQMLQRYAQAGKSLVAAHIFTAFGCYYEGDVSPERCVATLETLLDRVSDHGVWPSMVYLCDTIGAANPQLIQRVLGAVRSRWPDQAFALHLHDTRGLGLANALAGLQMGIDHFDTSIGGLGGCPFAGHRGAAGNISTEDFALMCEEMGIETGLDIDVLIECANLAESIVGHSLPGKVMRAGRVPHSPNRPRRVLNVGD